MFEPLKALIAKFRETFGFNNQEPIVLKFDHLNDHDLLYFTAITLDTSEYEVIKLAESCWRGELAPDDHREFDLDSFYGNFLNNQVSLPAFVRDYSRKVMRARHNKDTKTLTLLKGEFIA